MPLDRLVFIIVCVIAAAMATIYVAMALVASVQLGPILGLGILSVLALAAYIIWRIIAERVNNKDDDHYDRFEN